jgi:hypothetical protein
VNDEETQDLLMTGIFFKHFLLPLLLPAFSLSTLITYLPGLLAYRTKESGFDSRQENRFYLLHSIHTGNGAKPVSYPVVTGAVSLR